MVAKTWGGNKNAAYTDGRPSTKVRSGPKGR